MANAVGSYAGGEITKTAMLLAVTLMYGQCMANMQLRWREDSHGGYIGMVKQQYSQPLLH